jgi:hypothetical protein
MAKLLTFAEYIALREQDDSEGSINDVPLTVRNNTVMIKNGKQAIRSKYEATMKKKMKN